MARLSEQLQAVRTEFQRNILLIREVVTQHDTRPDLLLHFATLTSAAAAGPFVSDLNLDKPVSNEQHLCCWYFVACFGIDCFVYLLYACLFDGRRKW